ncbi:MAG: hypothetical protein ACF8XB_22355 [Planctomycetota bacterium JB042]
MNTFAAPLLLLVAVAVEAEAPDRVFPFDPVALVAGEEIEGDEARSWTHGRYTYRFATAENEAAFRAAPERYGIQLGGACARMGPLSGEGRTGIHAVHDGRLYIFASTQCRAGFLSSPEALIGGADAPPAGTEEELAAGRRLIAEAVARAGGAARLDSVRSVELRRDWLEDRDGVEIARTSSRLLVFDGPSIARRVDRSVYGDSWRQALVRDGDRGFFRRMDEVATMAPSQSFEFGQQARREPWVLLRAREADGFVAYARGTVSLHGEELRRVEVGHGGATTALDLDASGGIRRSTFRGRGPSLRFGTIERVYTATATVGGLTLPTAWEVTFDGERAPSMDRTITGVLVDAPVDEGAFEEAPW